MLMLDGNFMNIQAIDLPLRGVSFALMTDALNAILIEVRHHIGYGAAHRRSPMHTPIVGTADGDLRIMVLREFDRATNTLRFHTDVRSPKVAAILRDPAIAVLFYDPDAKVQIRVRGRGRTEQSGAIADAAWEHGTPFARRCYLAEAAPGRPCNRPLSGLPAWAEGMVPTEAQVAPGRENFAVMLVQVESFDWLFLDNAGHRRARFEFADGMVNSCWLVP